MKNIPTAGELQNRLKKILPNLPEIDQITVNRLWNEYAELGRQLHIIDKEYFVAADMCDRLRSLKLDNGEPFFATLEKSKELKAKRDGVYNEAREKIKEIVSFIEGFAEEVPVDRNKNKIRIGYGMQRVIAGLFILACIPFFYFYVSLGNITGEAALQTPHLNAAYIVITAVLVSFFLFVWHRK